MIFPMCNAQTVHLYLYLYLYLYTAFHQAHLPLCASRFVRPTCCSLPWRPWSLKLPKLRCRAAAKKREVFLQRSCLNDWMVYSLVENPKQLNQHRPQIAKYIFFGGKSGPSAHTAIDILQPPPAATPAPAPKLHSAHSTLTAAPSSCTLQRHQHASNQRHQHAGS